MGLKQLLTNLEAGTTADIVDSQPFYSSYNNGGSNLGGSVSLFDSPIDLFKNKSFRFSQGRAFDRPFGEFSGEPFIDIPNITLFSNQDPISAADVPRGGAILANNRAIKDRERIKAFFGTTKGRVFRLKQTGLQLMNPKIVSDQTFLEKAKSGGLFNALGDLLDSGGPSLYNTANRTYNPLGTNTLAQVRRNHEILGVHLDKSGLLPINAINNPKSNYEAVAKVTDRLNSLRGEHIVDNSKPLRSFAPQNETFSFGQKLKGFVVDTAKSLLGFSDSILFEYNHGPNSILGVGRTRIRKYQNSKINAKFRGDLNNDLDNDYILTLNTEKGYLPFSTPDSLKDDRGVYSPKKPNDTVFSVISGQQSLNINEIFRENNTNSGNPGVLTQGINKKRNLPYFQVINKAIDKINAAEVIEYDYKDNSPTGDPTLNDFIKFYFDVYTDVVDKSGIPQKTSRIQFRAFLESFGDEYNGNWNEFNYAGRVEPFYTYKSFNRNINFSFKIAAQSRSEIVPLYKKLNYLVSTTAPTYSNLGGIDDDSPRIRGTFVKVTIGDLLNNVPGFFSNIGLSWSKEYPWEIKLDPLGNDLNIYQNPHVLDVKCNFTPIHNFIPRTSQSSSFIIPTDVPNITGIQSALYDDVTVKDTTNTVQENFAGSEGAFGKTGLY